MDSHHFDNLTRSLARGASRRTVLKDLLGGVAGGLTGLAGRDTMAQRLRDQPNGAMCTRMSECASLNCVEGVCCDTACTGQCESCATGDCTPVSGPPPDGRPPCPGAGPCAATCDGVTTTHCAGWPGAETSCGPSTCANGSCRPSTTSCGLYHCDAAGFACRTACAQDADCLGIAHCTPSGRCEGDKGLGEVCTGDDDCQHGHCASSGVCCNEACDGDFQICDGDGFCRSTQDGATCPDGTCCDGDCVDTSSDVEHCSACDNRCPSVQCQTPVCQDSVCNSVPHPASDGLACDDDNACTTGAVCQDGVCGGGSPITCDDGNPCTMNDCDPVNGCVFEPAEPGTSCDDGNACNGHETCNEEGVCVLGIPIFCPACMICVDLFGGCVADAAQDGDSCGPDGRTCMDGVCACPNGQHDCDGVCRECCTNAHCTATDTPVCQDGVCVCLGNGLGCSDSAECCGVCVAGRCCTPSGGSCVDDLECCIGSGCVFDSEQLESFCA